MGLTSALYTGLTGLNTNQFRIDVIGDNIANINTIAFKGGRATFQTQFSQTFTAGSSPGQAEGGTNPLQIGLGSVLGAIQRQFTPGSIETTGVSTDLAIEGNGFFTLRKATNEQAFSRDGAFTLSATNELVSADGFRVQGYGVDDNFNLVEGVLTDIDIPLGTLSTAVATSKAEFDGNLSSGPDTAVATQGGILLSNTMVTDDAGTVPATASDLMVNLRDSASPTVKLFADGDTITLNDISKGGRTLTSATFNVTSSTTLQDFMTFMEGALGINTDGAAIGETPAAGLTVTGTGEIQLRGNYGTANEITIDQADILSSNATTPRPFSWTVSQNATGESVFTSFKAYDSLGAEVDIDVTMVLTQKATTGNTWRYYVESPDDSDTDLVLGSGTLTFDTSGRFFSATGNTFAIDRVGMGSENPMSVELDFSRISGLDAEVSTLLMTLQDGFPPGSLNNFSIGTDGTIVGTFTNGLSRTLGQIAMATFANPEGLVQESNNTYTIGPNSGDAIITKPLELGAGRILSGALELSNVDLSREFIGLITASTGFSGAGRVVSTANQLLDELLILAR
jgi:flagellar hook protein FlgE